MRISRGNEVIDDCSALVIKRRIEDGSLLPSDCYYDENTSEWLPLAHFLAEQTAIKADKAIARPCYCGSGLPFRACHGNDGLY